VVRKKLKIAVISPHYGYIKRGNEAGTRDINRYLRARGHTIDTFALGEQKDIIHIDSLRKDKGLGKLSSYVSDYTPLQGFANKFVGYSVAIEDLAFSFRAEPVLLDYINKRHYDLIWSNGEIYEAMLAHRLRKKTGTPILVFYGGGKNAMMLKEARLKPDIFAVMTPAMEQYVRKHVPDCNVFTTIGGIDLDFFNPKALPISYDVERPIILSSSAFIETKRTDLIVKAVSKLKKGTLLMSNKGPLQKKVCEMGQKLLGDRFKYIGMVADDMMPSMYKMADVLAMASRNEPYGRILLECMGTNTPVVCQRDATREWVVGEGGVLVDNCADIQAFADGIQLAIETNWGKNPRQQAEKFSWERTVDDYEEQIGKILC
jgi:glycosyltransferase involved in cell wall biosynthesis